MSYSLYVRPHSNVISSFHLGDQQIDIHLISLASQYISHVHERVHVRRPDGKVSHT